MCLPVPRGSARTLNASALLGYDVALLVERNNARQRDILLLLTVAAHPEGIFVNELSRQLKDHLSKVSIIKKYRWLEKRNYIVSAKNGRQRILLRLGDSGKDLVNDIQPFREWLVKHSELFRHFINQNLANDKQQVNSDGILSSLETGYRSLLPSS